MELRDMIIDTAITVLCSGVLIFGWAMLLTFKPETVSVFKMILALSGISVGTVGTIAGVWAVSDYFKPSDR